MVTVRLARHGAKKSPFYHVTVAEKSAKRDGRFIERIGFFNPVASGREEPLRIDLARLDHWLACGAQPSERVRRLAAQLRRAQAAETPGGVAAQSERPAAEAAAPPPAEAAPAADAPDAAADASAAADAPEVAAAEDSAAAP